MNAKKIKVEGNQIDEKTRCLHYHSPLDIVAIKLKCCNTYYACYFCHLENTDHPVEVWNKNEFYKKAILCGNCNTELAINEYLISNNQCPNCNAPFNPGCRKHYHYYFNI